jgi:peptidyl-prolyl cis-trans isomerase D
MLQQIRDRTSGIVAGFIVAIIVVPFAFWGVEQFNSKGGDPVVAKVGDQKIHQSQFRASYEQRYRQMQALMGENFRADTFDQKRFRASVLHDMTQETMLKQYTQKQGYRADDAALFEYISSIPAFQREGKFDTAAYTEMLARQGTTPTRFENQLREAIEIDQMREAITDTAFVTDVEAKQAYALANQERDASYALFDPAKYLDQASATDEQVKARYERDKSKYMAPERLKLAYVELSLEALAKAQPPSPEVLKTIYDAEKASRFTTQEERKARHILISFGPDKAASKKKAEDLLAKIKAGGDFAELAKANSDDTGSKTAGGDLGWVRRGQMVEKFEKALYGMKAGEVSDPVETEFGWHLIRLDEVKPSMIQPFEDAEVQKALIELYQNREQSKHFQELTEKLEQLAFENPASLEPVAKALDLKVQTTDWFTRAGGAGILANEAVKTAAFSPEILSDGDNSKPIPSGENTVVVIRKSEYEPPRQRPLDEVAAQVRDDLRNEAARTKAKADAAEVLAAVKSGKPLAEAVQGKSAEVKTAAAVRRDNKTEDHELVTALFKLPRPAAGAVSTVQAPLGDGPIAVIALTAVRDPEWPPKAEADGTRLRQQIRDAAAGAEFNGYRTAIAGKVKVEMLAPLEDPTPTPDQ